GLEGEDIAALARGVYRLADDPARHPPDVFGARRDEPVMGPAEGEEVARRLTLADRERASVVTRRLEHAERRQVDVRNREGLGLVRHRCEFRPGLEAAEEVRLLEDD